MEITQLEHQVETVVEDGNETVVEDGNETVVEDGQMELHHHEDEMDCEQLLDFT
jgi:hypothetical protein